jgi:type II secretory pathway pseudopilin PulG
MRTLRATHPAGSRPGHTLAELLLVTTILALFAGLLVPRLLGSRAGAHLNAAVQAAESDLAFARNRAIATGLRHQVALNAESGELLVVPYRPEEEEGLAAGRAAEEIPVLRNRLFPADSGISVETWSVSPLGYAGRGGLTRDLQGQALTFYAEGQADDALLILTDTEGRRRGLLVEGFTGAVRPMTDEELGRRR